MTTFKGFEDMSRIIGRSLSSLTIQGWSVKGCQFIRFHAAGSPRHPCHDRPDHFQVTSLVPPSTSSSAKSIVVASRNRFPRLVSTKLFPPFPSMMLSTKVFLSHSSPSHYSYRTIPITASLLMLRLLVVLPTSRFSHSY